MALMVYLCGNISKRVGRGSLLLLSMRWVVVRVFGFGWMFGVGNSFFEQLSLIVSYSSE